MSQAMPATRQDRQSRRLGAFLLACALLVAPVALVALVAPAARAQQAGAAQSPPAPQAAGYIVLDRAEVPVTITLTGRAAAQNATQLRPRVGGIITEVLYSPGTMVAEGTPLFAIDPLTYQIALASAEADHASAMADLRAAQTSFDRADRLRASNTGSQAALEDAEAGLLRARAALAAAEARINLARAELDWTTVRAPITGVIGLAQVAVGDLVTQGQATALAEIVQSDPVLIDLTEPYAARLRTEARAAAGEITLSDAPDLTVLLGDGRRIEGRGTLLSSGATVSATTGTRLLRFQLANPGGLVAPGMFIHAELTLGRQSAILVPQRAATRERDGSLTAWIATDGKAEKRRITETGSYNSAWVVTAGVTPGEWLLIDGINNLRDGAEIAPVRAEIDAAGVVRDAEAVPPAPAVGN